ncbi:MAG TPA: transcriptional regulator MntR [Clostridiaceae bacterium]|nr:transcriptional regulator MntR [Clostridiaceae bacterium]
MQNNEFYTVRGYQMLKKDKKYLTSAMEDYLEMIYRNIKELGYMRINTLSELLNVKPSSATKMVQKLTQLGFLDYKKYGIIVLTESGEKLGRFLLNRHNIIEKFLMIIGINTDILTETELIEHNVSPNTLRRINQLNMFLEGHPEVLEEFEKFKASRIFTEDPFG